MVGVLFIGITTQGQGMAWRRERGTARGYVNDDTGQRISYRAYRVLYEASEGYTPLDLPRLAKVRAKQAAYRDLVDSRHKLEQSIRVAAINDRGLTLEQSYAAEREALKVSKAAIMKSQEFKKDVSELKRLSKIKTKDRTRKQTRDLVAVLKRLDEDRASKAEASYLRRKPRVA